LDFSCTNNIAEYEALLLGLRKLKAMGIRRAILKTDSQVISGNVDKSSKARDSKLEKYLDAVRRLEASFEGFSVKNIPRGKMSMRICWLSQRHRGSLCLRKYSLKH
jgi:ribonuclease HI